MTKTRDYNRRSSNNSNSNHTPCLLCVDETGIEPNPICFESRLSAAPNKPTSALGEKRGAKGCSKVQVRVWDPDTVGMLTSDDIWWHIGSRSCPVPVPRFSPCCASLSNPLPLLSSQIWLLLLSLQPGLWVEVLQKHWYVFLRCQCAVGDKWMQVRILFLFKPWRELDFWLRLSGIMKQTDIAGFVEHNMKAWKEGVQQVRRPPSLPIFSLLCTVSSGGRSPMLNIYVFYSVHITHYTHACT